MPLKTRAATLLERIDTLEQHAAALQGASLDDQVKTEATHLVSSLEHARAHTQGAADIEQLDVVSRRVDEIGRRLAAVGRIR